MPGEKFEQSYSQLQNTLGRLEIALGAIDECVVFVAANGEIEWCNSSFETLVEAPPDHNLVGRKIEDVFPLVPKETEAQLNVHPFNRVIASGKDSCGIFCFGPNNLQLEITSKFVVLENSAPVVLFIIRDVIIAQEMAQVRLQRLVLEAASDAIVITDVKGRVQWVNSSFTKLTGYALKEIHGRGLKFLRSEKTTEETIGRLWTTILQGKVWLGQLVNKRKDGTEYTEEQNVTPVKDKSGRISHFIAIKRDITQRKILENKLLAARNYEIQVAAQIQESLLASQPPKNMSAFEFSAVSIPSMKVDGDFYEFLPHGPQIFDLLIGDVMGKGLQGALLGAATKSQFMHIFGRLLTNSGRYVLPSPQEVVSSLHAVLARELIALESFVTMVCARFDASCRRMSFVDCGHTQTLLFHGAEDKCEILRGENCPMGFQARAKYSEISVKFLPGDLFLFYSDGITEARNEDMEMFGSQRLIDFVGERKLSSAEIIMEGLLHEVKRFSNGNFSDDLTLVLVKVREDRLEKCLQANEKTISCDLNDLEVLRGWVKGFLENLEISTNLDEMEIERLILAINEATSNVMIHANQCEKSKKIQFYFEEFSSSIRLTILHEGLAFTPGKVKLPGLENSSYGGFGLFIVDKVFDQVDYSQESGGKNKIQLTKRFNH